MLQWIGAEWSEAVKQAHWATADAEENPGDAEAAHEAIWWNARLEAFSIVVGVVRP